MTVPGRLLVIDENLDKRLASQLTQRGRKSISVDWLGLVETTDPPLLRKLQEVHPGCVLVTGDDDLPGEHSELLQRLGLTVATVDGQRDEGWRQADWKRETVHRWVHVMENQKDATSRRYNPHQHRLWTRRKGRKRHVPSSE